MILDQLGPYLGPYGRRSRGESFVGGGGCKGRFRVVGREVPGDGEVSTGG